MSTPVPASESAKSPSRWKDRVSLVLLLIPALFAVSQIFIWNFWESSWGDSLKYLITYAQIILGAVLLLTWWFFFSPVSRRTSLLVGIPIILVVLGWIATIRSVEFSGHMQMTFHYRWEPTAEEKMAARQASQQKVAEAELLALDVPDVQPEDMPAYRGVNRDGVVIGPPLRQDWKESPPPELWRHPAGGGYASFSILGDFLLTIEQRGKDEAIVCYDATTGEERWIYQYPADFFEAMGGAGPRSTPTIAGDAVYTLGAFGDLTCLDLRTGKLRWHVNALQQFHVANTTWGMSGSPLVHDGKVIVNIGGQKGNGLIAYDPVDGHVIWQSAGLTPPDVELVSFQSGSAAVPADLSEKSVPGYSSPQLNTVAGELLILNFDGLGLRGHDPATGKELWFVPFENTAYVNVAQPVVFEDGRIFLSASYDVGAKMVRVTKTEDRWNVEDLWENRNMRCKFTSPVFYEGYLYGIDEGILVCLDPATGKRLWKGGKEGLRGRYNHGQLLLTNGQILALTEQGEAVLIQPDPKKLIEVASMRVLPEGKNWNPLMLCRGKLYVRNAAEMACYDLNLRP
ncbi:PQQ-binding-like beta-propeller repeat protein [Planctomicrobium sp. SH661]|uniref:PQQ-binding-like beta-propeller repeat protein n=1 Tax=Planctomicrobium sp. SH661 TaxID=3448124 RepID=UPI003F5C77B8